MKNSFTCTYHVNCVCVCTYVFIGFPPRSAVEFVAGCSNDPPPSSVSPLKLRLRVTRRRHPLWPLVSSTAGTGCHIPRSAESGRGRGRGGGRCGRGGTVGGIARNHNVHVRGASRQRSSRASPGFVCVWYFESLALKWGDHRGTRPLTRSVPPTVIARVVSSPRVLFC